MALEVHPPSDPKRVKVYELRDNDWFDRGTGFCTGQILDDGHRILVESEDEPDRLLLETKIAKDDGYQKQQETLIVWTEPNGTDMALSFQEAEGCAVVWDFVNSVQRHLLSITSADDALSDDVDAYQSVMLPPPELNNLPEIEHIARTASTAPSGRDALSKFVIREEYISKLIPLVTVAEDLESLEDLHRLCTIMKVFILLNDNTIIESVVADHLILGVVGALEYDPEFPNHKANHRRYLADQSRYKEVVPIKDPIIRRKIRSTWRLQYLKDVVLARILDDPTFSVLNSLIFYNQVDIVNHIQANTAFLRELFAVFDPRNADAKRKEHAVQFLHQCATIAKNLQPTARANLFTNLIGHGLFAVIAFSVKHPNPVMRTTGVDILVSLLDHDPLTMRGYMLKAVSEKKIPLTDTLIDLLHVEADLGVKNQLADAIKILLDPQIPLHEMMARAGSDASKLRASTILTDAFVQQHYDESAKRLFLPLTRLEFRSSLSDLTLDESTLLLHLVDILTFFVRQNIFRSRGFVRSQFLIPRITQLLQVPQKHLKLTALKFFRTLAGIQDTFYQSQVTRCNTLGFILDIICETMPRDNLLNSACLELFEYIKRADIKPFIIHMAEKYHEKLISITYVETFQDLVLRYELLQGYDTATDSTLFNQEETPTRNIQHNGQRWQGFKEIDAVEDEYFNTSDSEEEWPDSRSDVAVIAPVRDSSTSSTGKPLVAYPDDDDDNSVMDTMPDAGGNEKRHASSIGTPLTVKPELPSLPLAKSPPERLSEKRRREEEDEDELIKLTTMPKRHSSSASPKSSGTTERRRSMSFGSTGKGTTQGPMVNVAGSVARKKIAINISSTAAKPSCMESSSRHPATTECSERSGQEGNRA